MISIIFRLVCSFVVLFALAFADKAGAAAMCDTNGGTTYVGCEDPIIKWNDGYGNMLNSKDEAVYSNLRQLMVRSPQYTNGLQTGNVVYNTNCTTTATDTSYTTFAVVGGDFPYVQVSAYGFDYSYMHTCSGGLPSWPQYWSGTNTVSVTPKGICRGGFDAYREAHADVPHVAPFYGWTCRPVDSYLNKQSSLPTNTQSCSGQCTDNQTKAHAGNPVRLGSSHKMAYEIDLKTGGPFPITWDRTYTSSGYRTWKFPQQRILKIVKLSTYHYLHFRRGDGSWIVYKSAIPGMGYPHTWVSDQSTNSKDTVLALATDIVDGSGNLVGIILTLPDTTQEFYSSTGQLSEEVNAEGHSHHFSYTSYDRLASIFDDYGHHVDISYAPNDGATPRVASWVLPPGGTGPTSYTVNGWWNGDGEMSNNLFLVSSVSDGTRTVSYDYEEPYPLRREDGNLIRVHHSDGTTTSYTYGETMEGVGTDETMLTGIIDQTGTRWASYKYTTSSNRTVAKEWKHTAILGEQTEVFLFASGSVTDPLGNAFTFSANSANQITQYNKDCRWCKSPIKAKTITYTGSGGLNGGQPDTITDFNNRVEKRTYDSSKRLSNLTEGYGTTLARTTTYTWDGSSRRPATITVPIAVGGVAYTRTTTFTYDGAGRVLSQVESASNGAPSRTTSYTYNGNGLVETITTPTGKVRQFTYGSDGEVATATDGYGTTLAKTTVFGGYTVSGRLGWMTTPDGASTRYTWDAMDRPTKVEVGVAGSSGPGGSGGTWSATTMTYTPFGEIETLTRPDGVVFEWSYNVAHRATQLRQKSASGALLGQVDYTLNAAGEVAGETVSAGGVVLSTRSNTLDTRARLDKVIGSHAQQTDYNFDAQGNPLSVIDPELHTTSFTVDALNRITTQTNALSGATSTTYGPQDEVLTATDARGKSTGYSYNAFGELVGLSSPDAGSTGLVVDSSGRTTSRTDARGVVASYAYDDLDRLTGIAWDDTGVSGSAAGFIPGTRAATFGYDSCGNGEDKLCTIEDLAGDTELGYDLVGRLNASSFAPTGKTWGLVQGWVFDGANRETSHTYPSGKVLTSTYGADGQLESLTFDGTDVATSIAWQPMGGPVVGWDWGATAAGSVAFTYDQDGQLTGTTTPGLSAIVRDDDGLIEATTDASDSTLDRVFTYDGLHRLTGADRSAWVDPFTYGYDANSNLTTTTSGSTVLTNAISSSSNRLTSITPTVGGTPGTTINWSYDAAGNAVDLGPGFTLFYDATGRLVRSGSGSTATNFTVDATGLRRSKITTVGTYAGEAYYAYDQSRRLIGIYDASGDPVQEFIYLGDSWQVIAVAQGGVVYPVLSDQLGSPNQVLDPATGTVIWSWNSAGTPWGGQAAVEDPDADSTNFRLDLRFPGQIFDPEVGLVHNGFRDYDPGTGRYVQSDPIGLNGGWNTYGYVGGNPNSSIDPLGLDQIVVAIWNPRANLSIRGFAPTSGHILTARLDGRTLTSQWPSDPSLFRSSTNHTWDWRRSIREEGRRPDAIFLVDVPNMDGFEQTAKNHKRRLTWQALWPNKSQTNCAEAAFDALEDGGAITAGAISPFASPGELYSRLFYLSLLPSYSGVLKVKRFPWEY